MERLKQPITRILMNSVTNKKIGVYGDDREGRLMLQFKELGITLPGDSWTAGTTSPPSASGTLNASLEVAKAATDDGIKKGWMVNLNPMAPENDTNWPYWLTIRPKVKMPGVENNRHRAHEKSYSGNIEAITSTSGYVDDTYVLEAEDDILDMITNDTGKHDVNTDPISNMSKAVCDAYRAYIITTNNGDAITYTDEDGNSTAINAGASTVASANTVNGNATVKLFVKAIAINATQMLVMSRTAGYKFTVSVAGSNVIDSRNIMLEAKDEQVQFDVELPTHYGTLSGYSRYEIQATTAAGTTTVTVTDGSTVTSTAAINDAATTTYATNLNTGFTNASLSYIYASYDAYGGGTATWDIWATDAYERITFAFSATSTSTLVDSFSYFARYPSLTDDDVHSLFSNQKRQGKLNSFVFGDNAIQGSDYYKYTLTFKGLNFPAQHGTSDYVTHRRTVELYVLSTAADDDIYDANDPNTQYAYVDESAHAADDTNLEELLQIWSGLAVSSW